MLDSSLITKKARRIVKINTNNLAVISSTLDLHILSD